MEEKKKLKQLLDYDQSQSERQRALPHGVSLPASHTALRHCYPQYPAALLYPQCHSFPIHHSLSLDARPVTSASRCHMQTRCVTNPIVLCVRGSIQITPPITQAHNEAAAASSH